jgi:hypothetical protein
MSTISQTITSRSSLPGHLATGASHTAAQPGQDRCGHVNFKELANCQSHQAPLRERVSQEGHGRKSAVPAVLAKGLLRHHSSRRNVPAFKQLVS